MEFYTIGVYGSTEQSFFTKLKENGIDTFCDIRQRRGVRGKKYAYVNSTYLQNKLKEYGLERISTRNSISKLCSSNISSLISLLPCPMENM